MQEPAPQHEQHVTQDVVGRGGVGAPEQEPLQRLVDLRHQSFDATPVDGVGLGAHTGSLSGTGPVLSRSAPYRCRVRPVRPR
jgi:hypothetical protein